MGKIVQVSLTDAEYETLALSAEKEGVPVSLYIKSKVFEDTDFQKWFKELLERVDQYPSGEHYFNLKSVFGANWHTIPRGIRLALGRAFYNYVMSDKMPNVAATNKDSANTQWYKKG